MTMARTKSLRRMMARRDALKNRLKKNEDYCALAIVEKEIEAIMKPHRVQAKSDFVNKGITAPESPLSIGDMQFTYKAFNKSFATATFSSID